MKKNGLNSCFLWSEKQKILRVMKLCMLFIVCFQLTVSAALSQEKKVSLDMQNVSAEILFREIQRQTGYCFVFNEEHAKKLDQISIHVSQKAISEVLQDILWKNGLTWKFENDIIMVSTRDAQVQEEPIKVHGVVIDEKGDSIPGVTVQIKGMSLGTSTNHKGMFSLSIPRKIENLTLIFSFIGMESKEIKVGEQRTLRVILKEKQHQIDEVVVNTGYQNFDRRHLTSAVTSLKMEDIMVPGLMSVDQMLEGRIPGMIFMQNSGQVGATPRLRIRGTSTLLGNQEPLWVLDGVVLTDPVNIEPEQLNDLDFVNLLGNAISGLNPDDIEQIDVLKDAAATTVYGTKAANGVIVITTKKGHVGQPKVSYSFTSGIKRRPRYTMRGVDLMNSQERVEYSNEIIEKQIPYNTISSWVGYESALKDYYNGLIDYAELKRQTDYYETVNTDWFDIIFRDAFSHSHTLSVSGGSEKIKYYTSLGYGDDQGTLRGEIGRRYTMNSNLNLTFGKLFVSFGLNGNVQRKKYTPSEVALQNYAYNTSRAVPAYEWDGSLSFYQRKKADWTYPFNVLNERDNSSDEQDASTVNLSLRMDYNFIENWRASLQAAYGLSNTNRQIWFGENTWYVGTLGYWDEETGEVAKGYEGYSRLPVGGELRETEEKNETYSMRVELNYNRFLDKDMKHNISVSAFGELSSTKYTGMDITMRGYMKDRGMLISAVPEGYYPRYDKWRLTDEAALGKRTYTINNKVAGILTFMYSFDNKYIFNANMRVDASNKFGDQSNKRLLPIWSLSGRWNIKEDILKNANWIDDVALRVSFGYQGNMLDDQSPELIIKKQALHPFFGELYSDIKSFPNPNLRWEKTASLNVGLDFFLWKGKISGTLSGYYRKTTNAYMSKVISPVNGARNYTVNSGTVTNSGFECAFSFQPFNNLDFSQSGQIGGFSWRIDPQIGSVFNQLVDKLKSSKNQRTLEDDDYERLSYTDYLNGTIPIAGHPINGFYSYKFKGLDPTDGRPMFYGTEEENKEAYGKLTKEQLYKTVMEYSGCRQPFLQGGISSTMQWRRVVFSFNLSYSFGAKTRLIKLYSEASETGGTMAVQPNQNLRAEMVNRWKRPGDEKHTNIPGLLDNKTFQETLDPWFAHATGNINITEGVIAYPFVFAQNIWQMYDNSNVRVVPNDYVKLQSISIRYVVPEKFLKKVGISSAYVSVSGSNLFTIASKALKGQDPWHTCRILCTCIKG